MGRSASFVLPNKTSEKMETEMTAAETYVIDEAERVEQWRAEALERVGYGAQAAAKLAARLDVDLHRAIALVESGCPPETALQILL
jgi:hypothetical protein